METKANYTLIGGFTLAVIFAAFGFIYWFASSSASSARNTFEVVFSGSVSGLSQGSTVLFNGLKVGDVREINLHPTDPKSVIARITIDARTPIRSDTRARLEYQGLTGTAQIALTGGESTAPNVNNFIPGFDYPVLLAEKSDFQDIVESLRAIARRADDMLVSIEQVVKDNKDSISNIVHNVETFSKALSDNAGGIDKFLKSIGNAADKIAPLAEKLEELAKHVDGLVQGVEKDKVQSIIAHVESFTKRLDDASSHFEELINGAQGFLGSASGEEGAGAFEEIRQAAISFRKLSDNLNLKANQITPGLTQFSSSGLRELQVLIGEARRAVAELSKTIRSVEKNPQQFLFGERPSVPAFSGRRR